LSRGIRYSRIHLPLRPQYFVSSYPQLLRRSGLRSSILLRRIYCIMPLHQEIYEREARPNKDHCDQGAVGKMKQNIEPDEGGRLKKAEKFRPTAQIP